MGLLCKIYPNEGEAEGSQKQNKKKLPRGSWMTPMSRDDNFSKQRLHLVSPKYDALRALSVKMGW